MPVFFSVTVCELDVVPTVVAAKLSEVGLSVTAAAGLLPVPLTLTL